MLRQSQQDDIFNDLSLFVSHCYDALVLTACKRELTAEEVRILQVASGLDERLVRSA